MEDVATDVSIGLSLVIVIVAIYIGYLLYKRRKEEDIESGVDSIQKELELEFIPDEISTNSPKDLQLSTVSEKQDKESELLSTISSMKSSKSFKAKSKPSSFKSSKNGSRSGSRSGSRQDSINDSIRGSKNGPMMNDLINGSSYRHISRNGLRQDSINGSMKSLRNGSLNGSMNRYKNKNGSLVIKPSKDIPPPPPPSPLKSRNNDSVESLSKVVVPSDVSDSTYAPFLSSSMASSSLISKSESPSD